jgi:hypothetical protein
MSIFFSYANSDHDYVLPVIRWLERREMWVEPCALQSDDSLLACIRPVAEPSDRLVVTLSPASVSSRWLRHEVTSGSLMEMAQSKNFDDQFVSPILLRACAIPMFLRDRIQANFVNKKFERACQELYQSLVVPQNTPLSAANRASNRVLRSWPVKPLGTGRYALVIEFGVLAQAVLGLYIEVDLGAHYTSTLDWYGPPNSPQVPHTPVGPFLNTSLRRQPPIYTRRFAEPAITPAQSYYLYVEANEPLSVTERLFADVHGHNI